MAIVEQRAIDIHGNQANGHRNIVTAAESRVETFERE